MSSPAIEVQGIDRGSVAGAAALLSELRVSFAGAVSETLSRAICAEGIGNRRVVALVAREGEQIAGAVVAIIDARRFWKVFALRHPGLGIGIGLSRLGRLAPHTAAGVPPPAEPPIALPRTGRDTPSWAQNGPAIAKVNYVAVSERCRGRGVGRLLYLRMLEELARRGVRRVDARIDLDNVASIRLHQATGWTLYRDERGVFATLAVE